METVEIPMPRKITTAERRRFARQPVTAKGLVSLGTGREETEGQMVDVQDLTLQGVGFRSSVPFEADSVQYILVSAGPLRLSSRLRIVSSRPCGGGFYDVGGAFC